MLFGLSSVPLQVSEVLQLSCLSHLTLHHACDKDIPAVLQIRQLQHLVMHSVYIKEAGVEQLTGLQRLTELQFDSKVLNRALDATYAVWKFRSPCNTNKVGAGQQAIGTYNMTRCCDSRRSARQKGAESAEVFWWPCSLHLSCQHASVKEAYSTVAAAGQLGRHRR